MPSWVNRTVLSGASVAQNGTTSHTCTFTAATASNVLIAVMEGGVTFTTPSGWTLVRSAIDGTGLYVFSKTASASESSFTTTHNGSDYPIRGVVYEFYTGTTVLDSAGRTGMVSGSAATGPQLTGLTGTYTRFSARSYPMPGSSVTASCVWTLPSIEDYDSYIQASNTDGAYLTIAYDDGVSGSSYNPSSTLTSSNPSPTGEGVAWALSVISPPSGTGIVFNWIGLP